MTISEQIMKVYYEALTIGAPEPKSIYLGRREWNQLREEMWPYLRYEANGIAHDEFRGMRIYHVVEESHLAVS